MISQPEPLITVVDNPTTPTEDYTDRRDRSDRRQSPTSPWASLLLPAGRRVANRRADERQLPYYVDRYSSLLWIGILALIAASLADAALTLHILERGGAELNPFMSRLLDHGAVAFVAGKYLMTVVGLPVLLIFKNHRLFGTRLRVGHLIPVCVALYVVLIGYQIVLIDVRAGW